jgi:hypothetical protein
MRTRQQQATLGACVAVHGVLLAWLFASIASVGAGGASQSSGALMYLTALPNSGTARPHAPVKTPPPPKLPPITDTELPPVPQEALLELAKLPTLDADAASSASAAPASNGYDDPYAGAAINDYQGARASAPQLPPAPPLPPPQLDLKRWKSITSALKRSASRAHSLDVLVQIDTQGSVIDCQIIGGDTPPELQQRSCAMLKGTTLFAFEKPPSETQWHTMPEIVF